MENVKNMDKMELSRLHCVIPKSLFLELRETGLLKDIDNVVSQCLWDVVEREARNQRRAER